MNTDNCKLSDSLMLYVYEEPYVLPKLSTSTLESGIDDLKRQISYGRNLNIGLSNRVNGDSECEWSVAIAQYQHVINVCSKIVNSRQPS